MLGDLVLEDRLRGAVTPGGGARSLCGDGEGEAGEVAAETLEQARPRIVRFLTYDRVKDLVLDLRHRAKIESFPNRRPGAKP